jgi:hypothetical protein
MQSNFPDDNAAFRKPQTDSTEGTQPVWEP